MRGLGRQNENHLIKIEALSRLAGKDEVSVVNRIECAAVDADLFQTESIKQIRCAIAPDLLHGDGDRSVCRANKAARPNDPFFVSRFRHRFYRPTVWRALPLVN